MFITPSKSEVMPLTILEAQNSGLPVIALKGSNLNSIIIDNKNGMLLNTNPKIIANYIHNLFINKVKLVRFSKEARKRGEYFSVNKCAEKLEKIYLDSIEH
jgi:glycosyltransferase involved in cell wall biosynthesis